MPVPIEESQVLLGREPASREEAVRMIGELMIARGDVTPRYLESMLEKEARQGTWLTEGIALPHGANDAKSEIRRSSVVVLQMRSGVDWGGKKVYLAFGVAGHGNGEHLRLLAGLAAVLENTRLVQRMMTTEDPAEVVGILSGEIRA